MLGNLAAGTQPGNAPMKLKALPVMFFDGSDE